MVHFSIRIFAVAALIAVAIPNDGAAQCSGQPSANMVCASPDGSAGLMGARSLVVDDLPSAAWHSGNDGAGSGLDADLLDGVQGSAYATDTDLASTANGLGASLIGVEDSAGATSCTDVECWLAELAAASEGEITQVADPDALDDVSTSAFSLAVITDDSRAGLFRWDSSDLSGTLVASSKTSSSIDTSDDTVTATAHGFVYSHAIVPTTSDYGLTAGTAYWVIGRGSLIPRTLGTNIGNMTSAGGLAAGFDGTNSQAATASAEMAASSNAAYIGKTFAVGKPIDRAIVYGSSDQGFIGSGVNQSTTINLYCKTTAGAPASSTDGTLIGTITFTDTSDESDGREVKSTTQTTVCLHGWAEITTSGSNSKLMAELVIYQGKNADQFQIASSQANALAGTAVDLTADTGNVTFDRLLDPSEGVYVVPTGSSVTGSAGAWTRIYDGPIRPEWFGAAGDGSTNDTIPVQAMFNFGGSANFYAELTQSYLLDPVFVAASEVKIVAHGANLTLNSPGALIDLNPDAIPSAVEANSKQYVYWEGGNLTSNDTTPKSRIGIRIYAIREAHITDTMFGPLSGSSPTLTSGIQVGGLGGHHINNNRFYFVDKGIDAPDWGASETDVSIPITTSDFIGNEFTLDSSNGQYAFHVVGGWNRWNIMGGFINGSPVSGAIYFSNHVDAGELLIQGVRFEQALADSAFIHLDDTDSITFDQVAIKDVSLSGNPAGGGHTHIIFERVSRALISNTLMNATAANSNKSLTADANSKFIEFDLPNRVNDWSLYSSTNAGIELNASIDRTLVKFPDRQFTTPLTFTDYDGDAFSDGDDLQIDMSTLLGSNYPTTGVPPTGYTIQLRARDSGSAAGNPYARMARNSSEVSSGLAKTINLRGQVNDHAVDAVFFQAADANGDVYLDFEASGTDTLDVWLRVLAIHN